MTLALLWSFPQRQSCIAAIENENFMLLDHGLVLFLGNSRIASKLSSQSSLDEILKIADRNLVEYLAGLSERQIERNKQSPEMIVLGYQGDELAVSVLSRTPNYGSKTERYNDSEIKTYWFGMRSKEMMSMLDEDENIGKTLDAAGFLVTSSISDYSQYKGKQIPEPHEPAFKLIAQWYRKAYQFDSLGASKNGMFGPPPHIFFVTPVKIIHAFL